MMIHHKCKTISSFRTKSRELLFLALTFSLLSFCLGKAKQTEKSMAFLGFIRKLSSQGKLLPRYLERQVTTRDDSWDQPKWSRGSWCQELIGTLEIVALEGPGSWKTTCFRVGHLAGVLSLGILTRGASAKANKQKTVSAREGKGESFWNVTKTFCVEVRSAKEKALLES